MITRALAVLSLVLALLGSAAGVWGYHTRQALKASEARAEALQTALASERLVSAGHKRAADTRQRKLVALQQQQAKEARDVREALARNPDWAGQRVPDDVAAALGVQYPTPSK